MNTRGLLIALAVIGVFLLGAWFRFDDITQYPPGLFPDQAANGEDALLILHGDARPFYERGNGREALFFYIQAGLVALFGVKVWPMFLASAVVGLLTVVAIYYATRVFFGQLAGVLAAFLLATSYWHVTLSRTGFRAIMIPLFLAAFTACVGYVIQTVRNGQRWRSLLFAGLAGGFFSLGFYTYIAYRTMPGVILAVLCLLLVAALHPKIGFPHFRRYGWQMAVAVVVAGIVLCPLGFYFWQHPQALVGRAGQVSVFNPDLQKEFGGGTLIGTILYSTKETLLSFFVGQGDSNWRHSVPGHPLLNPLTALLFLTGFAWAVSGVVMLVLHIVRGKEIHLYMVHAYLLLLFGAMLVPVITTAEGMPHALRSAGLIVPIFMLAGMAGAVLVHYLVATFGTRSSFYAMVMGAVAGLLILSGLYDWSRYFLIARNDSEAYRAYRGDLAEVSEYIRLYRAQHAKEERPYLVLDDFWLQSVHYLTHSVDAEEASRLAHDYKDHPDEAQHPYAAVDPFTSHLTPLPPQAVIIFTQSTMSDADRYVARWGEAIELLESRQNRFGQEIMRVYRGKSLPGVGGDEADLDA